jgi:hypothetical protein
MLFSRKKNSSPYDVRFSRFRYSKAVRADTYGLAKVVRCRFWTRAKAFCHGDVLKAWGRPGQVPQTSAIDNRMSWCPQHVNRHHVMFFKRVHSQLFILVSLCSKHVWSSRKEWWVCVMKKLECCCVFDLHRKDSGLKGFNPSQEWVVLEGEDRWVTDLLNNRLSRLKYSGWATHPTNPSCRGMLRRQDGP